MAKILVKLSAVCCGTCQHWTGGRELVELGRRLACEDGVHPCPWRKSGSHARSRLAWVALAFALWMVFLGVPDLVAFERWRVALG